MLAIHPTMSAVNSLVDELGTVPQLRPALDGAMQRLREDFPGDNGIACGVMMLSEKLDMLMAAYEQFLADNKLGGQHAAVRVCAHVTETLFRTSTRPSRLSVALPGAAEPIQLTVRRPSAAGGPVHIEADGYYTKRQDAVFRHAAFVPAEEARLRTAPALRNVLKVSRDEVHSFLVGLCTAPGVSFSLEMGQTTLAREAAGEVCLTHARKCITRKR